MAIKDIVHSTQSTTHFNERHTIDVELTEAINSLQVANLALLEFVTGTDFPRTAEKRDGEDKDIYVRREQTIRKGLAESRYESLEKTCVLKAQEPDTTGFLRSV